MEGTLPPPGALHQGQTGEELLLCLPRLGCTCRACSTQDRHHPISTCCQSQALLGAGKEQGTEGELCLSTCSVSFGRNLTFLLLLNQGVLLPLRYKQRLGGHIRGEPQALFSSNPALTASVCGCELSTDQILFLKTTGLSLFLMSFSSFRKLKWTRSIMQQGVELHLFWVPICPKGNVR